MRKRLTKLMAFILVLCMTVALVPMTALAEEETSGDVGPNAKWKLSQDGLLTIYGYGETQDCEWGGPNWEWLDITTPIKKIVVREGITSLGSYLFYRLCNVESIQLPSTLENIKICAFPTASPVKEIKGPSKGKFYVKDNVLYGTRPVQYLDPVSDDGVYLIYYPPSSTDESLTVPEGVTVIGSDAVYSNQLKSISLPSTLEKIDYSAFSGCTNLQSISIPDNVSVIESDAFFACKSLAEIKLPAKLKVLDTSAFFYCNALKRIDVPASVKELICFTIPMDGVEAEYYGSIDFYFEGDAPKINDDDLIIIITNSHYTNLNFYYKPSTNGWQELAKKFPYNFCPLDDKPVETQPETKPETQPETKPETQPDPDDSKMNEPGVTIKQVRGSNYCTYAAVANMLRRYSVRNGISGWENIDDVSVRSVARGSNGINWTFTYSIGGQLISTIGESGRVKGKSDAAVKSHFIELLADHPEGVVIFNNEPGATSYVDSGGNKKSIQILQHAVLLTRYDDKTDTFYCVDSSNGASGGIIPLSASTMFCNSSKKVFEDYPGKQVEILKTIDLACYIISSPEANTLASTKITTHCPVEMQATIKGQTLDSRSISGSASNDYASMTVSGTASDRTVELTINGDYASTNELSIQLFGTDTGTMDVEIVHTYTDLTTDEMRFKNVPVTATTVGQVTKVAPQSVAEMEIRDVSSYKTDIWAAAPGEEVSEPMEDFGEVTETDAPYDEEAPSGPSAPEVIAYIVYTNKTDNGTVTVSAGNTYPGALVTVTVTPDEGYELKALTVTGKDGRNVALTAVGGGKYTFNMPASDVWISAEFERVSVALPFTDVSASDWFYGDVMYVYGAGLMDGKSDLEFDPDGTTTRAEAVTVLWRMADKPKTGLPLTYSDTAAGAWYSDAVSWAAATGIAGGYGDGRFGPNDLVTREQLATMLYRLAALQLGGTPQGGALTFADTGRISEWAREAMSWAAGKAIITGMPGNLAEPQGTAVRAQLAAIAARYAKIAA